MAGQLTIDTLKASSGVLATQNGMTGIAKAWAQWNGSTAAINGSFNVSSITKNTTGDYTINFTTSMPNANYALACGAGFGTSTLSSPSFGTGTLSTSSARIFINASSSAAAFDYTVVSATISSS